MNRQKGHVLTNDVDEFFGERVAFLSVSVINCFLLEYNIEIERK